MNTQKWGESGQSQKNEEFQSVDNIYFGEGGNCGGHIFVSE